MLGLVVKVSTFDDIVSIRKICTFSVGFQIFSGSQFYTPSCPTVTLAASASRLRRLTTLARHSQGQRYTAELSVDRRRCPMDYSCLSQWCQRDDDVSRRRIWWLMMTANRLCRQCCVTESHPSHRGRLQHTTTRSHYHLWTSVNQSLLPHVANKST